MTHKDSNWKRDTWKYDYESDFNKMKIALSESVTNHFPDYNLDWVLRVDASDKAVGAVLYQERPGDFGVVHEPIGFASQKFSNIASRWDAFKKEAYAAYYGVSHFAYYLRGKPFLLETDHRNLLWIEKSDVPIVVRWRGCSFSHSKCSLGTFRGPRTLSRTGYLGCMLMCTRRS